MMDHRWVAGFLSGMHYNEIIFFVAPPTHCLNNSKASWLLSVTFPGSPHHKSIHPPKQEDLSTLSRAPPYSKEGSPFLQTTVPYCLLYHTLLGGSTLSSPHFKHSTTPHPRSPLHRCLKTTHTRMETLPRSCYRLEFFILVGPIAFFIVLLHSDFSPGC